MSNLFELFCDFTRLLRHEKRDLKFNAAVAVCDLVDSSCANVLLQKIELENDMNVKATLVKALGKINEDWIVPEIYRYLDHDNPRIRSNALESLGEFTQSEVTDRILQCVSDSNNRVSATAIKMLCDRGERSGFHQLDTMMRSSDFYRRASANWIIGELKDMNRVDYVIENLGSSDYVVHTRAAITLRKFGPLVVDKMIELLDHATELEKCYIAIILGDVGDKRAQVTLLRLLDEDDNNIRRYAVEALGKLNDPNVVFRIKDYLKSDNRGLVLDTLIALRRLEDRRIVPDVIELLQQSEDKRIIATAIAVLGEIGDFDVIPHLKNKLESTDRRIRSNAMEAIGKLGDIRIIEQISPYLDDEDNRMMANTAVTLYGFGDMKVVNFLREKLESGTLEMRMSAAYAMGEIGLEEVVRPLISSIMDDTYKVRERVLKSLMKVGDKYQDMIVQAGDRESGLYRVPQFVKLLGKFKVKETLQKVLDISLKKHKEIKFVENDSISLLKELKGKINDVQLKLDEELPGIEKLSFLLEELLMDDDPNVRTFAIFSLGELQMESGLAPLICQLKDGSSEIRYQAVDALSKIGDSRALSFIKDMVNDPNLVVKKHAILALGHFGTPEALDILTRLASSMPDERFKPIVEEAIEECRLKTEEE